MNKLTEWDKCVLYLIERGGEVRVCEMGGKFVRGHIIGSQADKRMYEVMEDVEKNGWYELEGMRYVIKAGKSGKYKTYEVTGAEHKPVQKVTQVVLPDGTRGVRLSYV